jgi:hypothetical protein
MIAITDEEAGGLEYPICDHLAAYRDRLREAESAYAELNAGVDRFRQGRTAAAKEALAGAVERWLRSCDRLRELLVKLVAAGDVVMPHRREGMPRCARCRCAIHRLEVPEWEFSPEGVRFRGAEFVSRREGGTTADPANDPTTNPARGPADDPATGPTAIPATEPRSVP